MVQLQRFNLHTKLIMVGICKLRYLKKNIELLTSTPPIIKNHDFHTSCRSGDEEKQWG